MAQLSKQQIEDFLAEPHVGHVVTVRPNGRPHVAPVWFLCDGDRAFVMCHRTQVKVRNLQYNTAASLSVVNDQRPYRHVILEGEAEVTNNNVSEMVKRLCIRYEGSETDPSYAEKILSRGSESRVLMEIRIDRVKSWSEAE